MYDQIDRHICMHAWYDRNARELMAKLCGEIGPRPAGSAAMASARKLLAYELDKMGAVDILEEDVTVPVWHPGNPAVELINPQNKKYPCVQCIGTMKGEVASGLVHAGNARPDIFSESGNVIGDNIVIMDGHGISGGKYIPVAMKAKMLCDMGAKAVIVKSVYETGFPAVELMCGPDILPIPCLSVSRGDGNELEKAAFAGDAFIKVAADGYSEEGLCANLIADIGPGDLPEETIILGAHLDSMWNAPGALDNLTGVVTALEVARLLAPYRNYFRRKLRLIFYTAEEIAMLGSKAYVKKHIRELDRVRFVMNMDSIFPATTRGMAVMWAPDMRDYISRIFEETGLQADVRDMFCMSSDYLPFMLAGLPAARPADMENSLPIWSHTDGDVMDNIRIDWIQHNAMVYSRLTARMLMDESLPSPERLLPDEVGRNVEKEGIVEAIRFMGYDI